jgi:hypothetical protein
MYICIHIYIHIYTAALQFAQRHTVHNFVPVKQVNFVPAVAAVAVREAARGQATRRRVELDPSSRQRLTCSSSCLLQHTQPLLQRQLSSRLCDARPCRLRLEW